MTMSFQPATLSDLARSITRPVVTVGALGAWVAFIATDTEYPGAFQWLTVAMCLEWFTERAYKRLVELRPAKDIGDAPGGKQP